MEEIRSQVKKELDKYRYQHTLGVMYTSAALAMKYESDIADAMLAGLLHDCAKCIPDEKKIRMCSKYGIPLTETELANKALIHPKLGAFLAKTEYEVENQEVLDAIKSHTTGRPEMSLLEKIVYIADYIEPGRTKAFGLAEIRKLAFEDIDSAMYRILDDTLAYLNRSGGIIDSATESAHHYYQKLTQHKDTI